MTACKNQTNGAPCFYSIPRTSRPESECIYCGAKAKDAPTIIDESVCATNPFGMRHDLKLNTTTGYMVCTFCGWHKPKTEIEILERPLTATDIREAWACYEAEWKRKQEEFVAALVDITISLLKQKGLLP